MRIARFVHQDAIAFGTIELAEDGGEHPDSVQVLNGDPLVTAVGYTGERLLRRARVVVSRASAEEAKQPDGYVQTQMPQAPAAESETPTKGDKTP